MGLRRKTAATLCAGAALAAWAAPVAAADPGPVSVGLTVTPDTAAVGDRVTVVATVTNNTSAAVSAALGIENPRYSAQKITAVGGKGCTPRNLQKLIDCGNPALGPGFTASITVTLKPTATGVDDFTAYGRITGTNDVYAHATLTVS
ncbi:hypothetical protein IU500_28065 [Nocardia terpenica]|uniref:hypothetical protein n=1 Tax=Nocardia terpenica TaxID=455432 RepID=UPI0018946B1D|nr:hypothetical protein [Nocardia terpenica]MBF6065143.1 hypothetical protein [Nocardia terpenica]MBF6107871.1 hypothetical protein [Nocardia terpenica]MBF6115598.1 hypothetical protein [Nocardia terpenica]MBF6122035.1 hypothetical protein [Nocardia terpenica]MBF6155421.1 hypothetical protein [Nocardia terpenica]